MLCMQPSRSCMLQCSSSFVQLRYLSSCSAFPGVKSRRKGSMCIPSTCTWVNRLVSYPASSVVVELMALRA